jgi:SH3-like domain-containing protein
MPAIRFSRGVILLGFLAFAELCVADSSPYEAYVCVEQADVVAGPGHRYYTTNRLPRGTIVEIYREEASGWLAIRPPEGSFSWVPSDFVERTDDGKVGRVKQSTGAWIGTAVEHVDEHQQQVMLKAGELVQIEAEKNVTSKSGSERQWLKIAPPAGEYRWIHLRDVSRQKPADETPAIAEAVSEVANAAEPKPEPRRIDVPGSAITLRELRQQNPKFDRNIALAQYRKTTSPSESASSSSDGFVPRKRRDSEPSTSSTPIVSSPAISSTTINSTPTPSSRPRLDPPDRIASSSPISSVARSNSAPSFIGNLSNDEINRQLDQIEVDLSLMVAKDQSEWNLPALKRRVETLVDSGVAPAARGRARLTLEKIKQFEETFHSTAATVARSSSTPKAAAADASAATNSLADPRYDAQGWLKPVVSRKGDKPAAPYAVVDSEGHPLTFISPAPGLNLNRYLNKQVGLYGRRGYLEELKRPHVVAERVIDLDTHVR